MGKRKQSLPPVDSFFLTIVLLLVGVGFFIFISAALGVLAKDKAVFYNILFSQLVLGLVGGLVALYLTSRISYKFWRQYSFYFFIIAIGLTALVFIPALGFSHGGAQRWLSLGPFSFQPAEVLKLAFVLYFAGWLSWAKDRIQEIRYSIIPLIAMLGVIAFVLLRQPDTKSFLLILLTAIAMLFVSGIRWKYVFGIIAVGFIGLVILVSFKPYLMDRVQTFLDPSRDPRGSSYQLQQSLIAIGSGGLFGRGYGQSVQKFSYLPESHGDSIFAVAGEEFGFIGTVSLIILFVLFCLRGLRIAYRAPDTFSRLFVSGTVILLVAQSFLNIASMIGVFPLTGVPLVFISHGGTSLLISLAAVGVILNISRYQKKTL